MFIVNTKIRYWPLSMSWIWGLFDFFFYLFGYILLLQVECCPSIVFHSVYFPFFFLSMCPFSFDWMYRPHVVCLDCFLFYFVGLSFLPPLHSLWFPVLDFHVCFHLLLLVLTCVCSLCSVLVSACSLFLLSSPAFCLLDWWLKHMFYWKYYFFFF